MTLCSAATRISRSRDVTRSEHTNLTILVVGNAYVYLNDVDRIGKDSANILPKFTFGKESPKWKHSSKIAVNSRKDRSHHHVDLRRGRSERKNGQRAGIVLPRTITTEGSFTNFDTTPLGSRHAAGLRAATIVAREGQARAGFASLYAPPKPKGLALFQGRRPSCLGVIRKRVRARERGPGHRDGIRTQRGRRRRWRLLGVVS